MPETNARCVLRTANDVLARLAKDEPLAAAIIKVATVCAVPREAGCLRMPRCTC
jgi:hypothetical protein